MKKFPLTLLLTALATVCSAAQPPAPYGPVPTEPQLRWQRMEWYAFMHFGINTYTDREWGYGNEDISLFNPTKFNADKVVATLKEAGMPAFIYTAKHHDGWCAWPTKTTKHNITRTPYKKGKGDIVRAWSKAAAKHGMKFGVYLSPWDRNHAEYGRPGYQKAYMQQITELLTNYGPIFEIWFDGANGGDGWYGGAQEKRNIGDAATYYRFPEVVAAIRKLQPQCIIWGAEMYGDVHWGGSEKGFVKYPCRNVTKNREGKDIWNPLEADTTINRRGWFWHPNQQTAVKPPKQLMQIYMDSVGRGANLILNIAPNRDGELDAADVASLLTFGKARRELLAKDYALHAAAQADETRGNDPAYGAEKLTDGDIETYWSPNDGTTTGTLELTLPQPETFDIVRLREQIRLGQRVRRFRIEVWQDGAWQTADAEGQSIGNQVMRQLPAPVTTDRLRVVITESDACPCLSEISLLRMPLVGDAPAVAQDSPLPAHWQQREQGVNITEFTQETSVGSIAVTPRKDGTLAGMVNRFRLEASDDGHSWHTVLETELGNLRANPIEQRVSLPAPVKAKFFRFTPTGTLEPGDIRVGGLKLYEK
ncbi:MAG: alpha-L-fucosidase [Akkermansia sp.]|nr:alpha-L-fucosidase [Akkermansia sp.]